MSPQPLARDATDTRAPCRNVAPVNMDAATATRLPWQTAFPASEP